MRDAGDYRSANILCATNRVRGVIDWDDARVVPCLSEGAWASWNLSGGDRDRFRALLTSYANEDGMIDVGDQKIDTIVPYMAADVEPGYSPVTRNHAGTGMSIADLCAAAVVW